MKQPFRELPSDFEITKPVEEWSNGLLVSEFKALGLTWDLKRSIPRVVFGEDEPPYTYLKVAYADERKVKEDPAFEWLRDYHFPTLPGTVDPESAAMFLGMMLSMWARGRDYGYAKAQRDIRKAIGIK
jgi:hypothetical protein